MPRRSGSAGYTCTCRHGKMSRLGQMLRDKVARQNVLAATVNVPGHSGSVKRGILWTGPCWRSSVCRAILPRQVAAAKTPGIQKLIILHTAAHLTSHKNTSLFTEGDVSTEKSKWAVALKVKLSARRLAFLYS